MISIIIVWIFRYKAVEDFEPSVDAELSLNIGDIVCVLEDFSDGWMAGMEEKNGRIGLFPARCVQRIWNPYLNTHLHLSNINDGTDSFQFLTPQSYYLPILFCDLH